MAGLAVHDMRVRYGDTVAVDGVSLTVDGEVLAILGPSGCGKSTLLRAIAGLEPLESGTVEYDGEDQTRAPVHRRGFGLMFQDGQLFEHLSVGGNVAYGLRRAGIGRSAARQRAEQLLESVGLAGYADRSPATLSGGERQRDALARSLAPSPRLLLLDEPLSALDRTLRTRLATDVRRVLTETETNALLVTHDHEEAFAVADRVAIMDAGRIVQIGSPRQVWSAPADAKTALFLGYDTVLGAGEGRSLREACALGSGAIALRATALRVDDSGPLAGVVVEVTAALDELRLRVELSEGLQIPAVAGILSDVRRGMRVRVTVDESALAHLP